MLTVLGGLAEFERSLIMARTHHTGQSSPHRFKITHPFTGGG
jgi:hypothetical protein